MVRFQLRNLSFVFIIVGISSASSACVRVPGYPNAATSVADSGPSDATAKVRQNDDAGRRLPFTTRFPRRWSNGNDGTTYEPCTAASSTVLDELSLEPSSVRDAAIADHQTARGCRWSFTIPNYSSLTQIVGNQPPLDIYKARYAKSFDWRPETLIDGRRVVVGSSPDRFDCATFLQSKDAIVITRVSTLDKPPPISEICDKAIAFTRATIDQMPE